VPVGRGPCVDINILCHLILSDCDLDVQDRSSATMMLK
jgi:hypothetical protein